MQRGHFHAQDGDLKSAIADYRLADERFQAALAAKPGDGELSNCSWLKRNLGNAWFELGKQEKSADHLLTARRLFVEAIDLGPAGLRGAGPGQAFRNEFAENYNALAVVEKQLSHPQEAIAAHQEAVRIRRDLVSRYPGDLAPSQGLSRA